MADRKVSVALELQAGQFKAEADVTKAKVEGLDRSVKELDRDITKIPLDAARAAAAMKLLGGDVMSAGQKFATVSDKAIALDVVNARIRTAQTEVRKLGDEFVRTGGIDVFEKLTAAGSNLRGLQDIRKRMVATLTDAGDEGGRGFWGRFANLAGSGLSSMVQSLSQIPWAGIIFKPFAAAMQAMPPEAQLAIGVMIAGGIVASSAFIGAALNSVLISAVGLGGLAAGIVGQISNPAVQDAFTQLWQTVKLQFEQTTASFAGPLVTAAHMIGGVFEGLLPHLHAGFEGLATTLLPLVAGLSGMINEMTPGLDRAFAAAVPMLKELAAQLPGLGKSISFFFTALAQGSTGATEGLRALFMVMEGVIAGTGALIGFLSNLFEAFVNIGVAVSGAASAFLQWLPVLPFFRSYTGVVHGFFEEIKNGSAGATGGVVALGAAVPTVADNFKALSSAINDTVVTADTLAGQMTDKLMASLLSADHAAMNFDKALVTLGDTLVANGGKLSAHVAGLKRSETGAQQNKDAVLAVVEANLRVYDSFIAVGGSAEDAAAKYSDNTRHLEDQLRAAGMTQAAIDGLIGKYRNVPANVNTAIAIHGLETAIANLNTTLRLINGIHDKTITVTTRFATVGRAPGGVAVGEGGTIPLKGAMAHGGVRTAATGLVVAPRDPGTVLMGEPQTGGEVLTPLRGISQANAMALSQVAGNAYGFDVLPRAAASGGWSSSGGTAAAVDLAPVTAEIRRLRAAISSMSVQMDGKAVGRIQGRNADIYARTG